MLALCLIAAAHAQSTAPRPYRILLSNDDGVRAPMLPVLAQALRGVGEVIIVAPAEDQSGVSQALTAAPPILRTDLTLTGGLPAIALTATPATSVQIAIKNIVMPRPDLVVTGINPGYNLGTSGFLSGTVGAARQAVMEGVPAVATSMATAGVPRDVNAAAQQVVAIVRQVHERGLPPQTFLNVNIPAGEPKGFAVTVQAMQNGGTETFSEARDDAGRTLVYFNVYKEGGGGPEGTDMWAVDRGLVSVTPMRIGEHEPKMQDAIKGWFK